MSDENDQTRSFEDKVQDRQDAIEAQFRKISRGSWARIIRMARKPTPQEFKQTSIICGIGLFVLGFIGFVMLIVMDNFYLNVCVQINLYVYLHISAYSYLIESIYTNMNRCMFVACTLYNLVYTTMNLRRVSLF